MEAAEIAGGESSAKWSKKKVQPFPPKKSYHYEHWQTKIWKSNSQPPGNKCLRKIMRFIRSKSHTPLELARSSGAMIGWSIKVRKGRRGKGSRRFIIVVARVLLPISMWHGLLHLSTEEFLCTYNEWKPPTKNNMKIILGESVHASKYILYNRYQNAWAIRLTSKFVMMRVCHVLKKSKMHPLQLINVEKAWQPWMGFRLLGFGINFYWSPLHWIHSQARFREMLNLLWKKIFDNLITLMTVGTST